MYEFEFTGRAPSGPQIKAHLKKAVAAGHNWIQISWGENQITLEKQGFNGFFGPWFGHGWIRRIGGDDLARELSNRNFG
jgi:hypothetical protein